MKISKKTRDQAILVASTSACSGMDGVFDNDLIATLGVSREALELHMRAWEYVAAALEWDGDPTCPEWDAEAEALLREGWTPKGTL